MGKGAMDMETQVPLWLPDWIQLDPGSWTWTPPYFLVRVSPNDGKLRYYVSPHGLLMENDSPPPVRRASSHF